jgi:serine/threonine protein kinase
VHVETGRIIGGRFHLLEQLGYGGFGRVWRAYDARLDVDVAVKEVRIPPSSDHEELVKRAEREARNGARLRGAPNVLPIYDVFVEDGVPWMVMELIDGASLDVIVRDSGRLGVDEVTTIAEALLGALRATHAAEVLHRDIKPANVLRARDGRFLLTDFGISRYETDATLTQSGVFIGSPRYTAPERWLGKDSVPGSDMFALGVTLYELAEGRPPFDGEEPAAIMRSILDDPPAPMTHGRELEPVIARMLAKDPAQRPTAEQALRMLREPSEALASRTMYLPGSSGPQRAGKQSFRLPRPGRWLVIPASLVVSLALLTGIGYANLRPLAYYVSDDLHLSGSAWTVGKGSCLHFDQGATTYFRTWRAVPCWSAAADYRIVSVSFNPAKSGLAGCPAHAGTSIDGFAQRQWIRLCLVPDHPPWNPY